MKLLELFCGTKSLSKVFQEKRHETFTIDNNSKFKPDVCLDILYMSKNNLPKEWRNPEVIWCSPPCETFSLSGNSFYHGYPTTPRAYIGLALAYKCVELIREFKPRIWFIENPRAGLRPTWFMKPLYKNTVTYCQYGETRMKPTDIWTNLYDWKLRSICKNGDSCHESAPRSSKSGTQGEKSKELRGTIPRELCIEIYEECNKFIGCD